MMPFHTPCPHTPSAPGDFEVESLLAAMRRKAQEWSDPAQADPLQDELPACPIAPRELPPGSTINGFTLERVLGSGGFAVTYLATEDATGQRVVIKELFPESLCYREDVTNRVLPVDESRRAACRSAQEGFLREHHLLTTLQHPHILRATDCFNAHNTVCYAAEYIDGTSLAHLVEDYADHGYRLPQEEVYATLVRLLDALAYLHGEALLHRDIKPDNILITRDGLPKLIDFGAAHNMLEGEPSCVVEVPGFSPAEQASGRGEQGPWTDLYALGATFRYLLTGRVLPPCRQRELVDTAAPLAQQLHLRTLYHPKLLTSIDRATHPHASERFQRAEDWLAALHP